MVILHERQIKPGCLIEALLVETLEKETAIVAENLGFDQQHIGDGK